MRSYLVIFFAFVFSFRLFASSYGVLDSRFVDKNGDLLADTPTNKKELIDPPYLIFSYTPHESADIYKRSWSDFVDYLSEVTGKSVVYFLFRTKEAELEAMRYGMLHVAGFSTGMVPDAVNYAGFHPFAIMADKNNKYGYTMEIITNSASNIKDIKELKGSSLTLTSPYSNSGYKLPIYILQRDYNLKAKVDYSIILSGKHSKSIKGVADNRYKMAAIASSVKKRMIDRGDINSSDIKTLYKSKPFPTTGYGYIYNLEPSLVKKIKKAFLTYNWRTKNGKPSSLKKEFRDKDKFIEINYKDMWQEVREISKKY